MIYMQRNKDHEYDDDGDGQREDYDEVYDESPIALVYRGDL